jgi:hypothetical protein
LGGLGLGPCGEHKQWAAFLDEASITCYLLA